MEYKKPKPEDTARLPKIGEHLGRLTVDKIFFNRIKGVYEIYCTCDCGNLSHKHLSTIYNPEKQMCKMCRKKLNDGETLFKASDTEINKSDKLTRPFTKDTKWLICMWHSEGNTPEEIAGILDRDTKVIIDTITKCRIDGSYDKYAEKSFLKS